ncbi:hypothetical protein Bca4012_094869 [Brassica carinata]|uniref:Uncharacterized protein n=1 Tax=Brassica carinata TaxID=52824 RepID=A0A8X7PVA4_BRACI|nr:hypothetical protein Bca52824_077002 [Brassica carinata]
MNFDLPSLPASLVGGRVRPRRLFAYPFSSPATSHGEVPEADNEVILMAPLKQRCSYVLDDGPCSEIQEEDLIAIQRKYAIHSSVQMRSPSAFERTADRGPNEMAVFEAYLVAGFRGIIPSLVAEISSFFGFCPSQLTPLSLRTLISIQVLGNSMKVKLPVIILLFLREKTFRSKEIRISRFFFFGNLCIKKVKSNYNHSSLPSESLTVTHFC